VPGPLLFDVLAYNMYSQTGRGAASIAANTAAGILRDAGVAVPLAVCEYAPQTSRRVPFHDSWEGDCHSWRQRQQVHRNAGARGSAGLSRFALQTPRFAAFMRRIWDASPRRHCGQPLQTILNPKPCGGPLGGGDGGAAADGRKLWFFLVRPFNLGNSHVQKPRRARRRHSRLAALGVSADHHSTLRTTICGHSVICSVFSDARNFDALFGDDTADSPRWASRWAAESVALLQSVSAAYAFRFSTNPDSANPNSKIKKVGPAADIVQPPAEWRSVTTFSDVMADRKAHPCPLLA